MKNFKIKLQALFVCFILISIYSCSKTEEDNTNKNIGDLNKKSVDQKEININNQDFIKEDLKNFFGGKKYKIVGDIKDISIDNYLSERETAETDFEASGVLNANTIYGPFNYTLVNNGVLQSDAQVVLSNSTGYATGVYFCDICRYSANIVLPNNTTGWVVPNSLTNQCYVNYSNQTLGYAYNISVTSSGLTTLNVNTYYLKVKYNILGQWLGGYNIPSITATPTLKYKYMNI